MFIEFCDGGALDSIIIDLEKGLTEKQIAYVGRGMCQGLVHLHKQGIIHRDLKAGNVLLTIEVLKFLKSLKIIPFFRHLYINLSFGLCTVCAVSISS
jgi:serine/threonine protein kinase